MEIVKYMSFMQFMSICETKKMFLSRIDRWDDKREGIMIKALVKTRNLEEEYKKELYKYISQLLYAQSWFISHGESDLMWHSYAGSNGIMIMVDSEDISRNIQNELNNPCNKIYEFIGECNVKYTKNNQTPAQFELEKDCEEMIKTALQYKNDAYVGENEYRYIAYNKIGWEKMIDVVKCTDYDEIEEKMLDLKNSISENKINYDVEFDSIKEIRLNPMAKIYESEVVESF